MYLNGYKVSGDDNEPQYIEFACKLDKETTEYLLTKISFFDRELQIKSLEELNKLGNLRALLTMREDSVDIILTLATREDVMSLKTTNRITLSIPEENYVKHVLGNSIYGTLLDDKLPPETAKAFYDFVTHKRAVVHINKSDDILWQSDIDALKAWCEYTEQIDTHDDAILLVKYVSIEWDKKRGRRVTAHKICPALVKITDGIIHWKINNIEPLNDTLLMDMSFETAKDKNILGVNVVTDADTGEYAEYAIIYAFAVINTNLGAADNNEYVIYDESTFDATSVTNNKTTDNIICRSIIEGMNGIENNTNDTAD